MSTESRNPRSTELSSMSSKQIVDLMNAEERFVLVALEEASQAISAAAERVAEAIGDGGRVIYVGAGTSGRIATLDAAEIPPTFGVPRELFHAIVAGGKEMLNEAVEGAEDDAEAGRSALADFRAAAPDVVIGLAASGRTPFVLATLDEARVRGCWTCGIANNPGTPLLDFDHAILLDTGPEVLTGSTRLKAGTSQKLALNRISTAAMVLSGKAISNLMVDVRPTNDKLRKRAVSIVSELSGTDGVTAGSALEATGWDVRKALASLNQR